MDVGAPQLAPEKSRKPELTVVAALILRDSKILVCQRRRDDTHACNGNSRAAKSNPAKRRRKRWCANFAKNSESRPRSAGNFFARGIATANSGRNSN